MNEISNIKEELSEEIYNPVLYLDESEINSLEYFFQNYQKSNQREKFFLKVFHILNLDFELIINSELTPQAKKEKISFLYYDKIKKLQIDNTLEFRFKTLSTYENYIVFGHNYSLRLEYIKSIDIYILEDGKKEYIKEYTFI